MFKMATDPVPNIRFNIAKTIEVIYDKLNNENKEKCRELLEDFEKEDKDFDVVFYSQKALKNISQF
jgi:hypothetical protein